MEAQKYQSADQQKQNIKEFYFNFVQHTHDLLNQQQSVDFTAQIQQKLKNRNIFEKGQRQSNQIIMSEREKVIHEMDIHVSKCPFSECKEVLDEVMIYGMLAGKYKEDPLKYVGYQVYERRHKTGCPFGKTLNEKMLKTHQVLKSELNKYVNNRVL